LLRRGSFLLLLRVFLLLRRRLVFPSALSPPHLRMSGCDQQGGGGESNDDGSHSLPPRNGRTSAADLKFLHHVPRVHLRNFKSKSGTRIVELLVPFSFRSSCPSVPRCITNFENRALREG